MAIQNRRGAYTNFDPTKMVPGEFAVVQSNDPAGAGGLAIYMCFVAGTVERIALVDDLEAAIAALQMTKWVAADANSDGNIVISLASV